MKKGNNLIVNTKKILLISCLLIIVLFLSSCKQGSGSGFFSSGKTPVISEVNYRTGTEGLDLSFVKNMPPSKVTEGRSDIPNVFSLGITLENEGAYDIQNAIMIIGGYDDSLITLDRNKEAGINLKGTSRYSKQGDKETYIFEAEVKPLPPNKEEEDVNFLITTCYPYQTVASSEVCIIAETPDFEKSFTPACVAKDSITLSSQGAPVQVSKVEPLIYKYKDNLRAEIKIHIKNKQKGEIRASNTYQKDCVGPGLVKEDLGKINVRAKLGNKLMDCDNGGDFTYFKTSLYKKTDINTITCIADLSKTQQNYITILNIELDYGYVQITNKKIEIEEK